jgi:hypothetical protein
LREPAAGSSAAGRFGWIFFSAILDAPSISRVPSGARLTPRILLPNTPEPW